MFGPDSEKPSSTRISFWSIKSKINAPLDTEKQDSFTSHGYARSITLKDTLDFCIRFTGD